MKNNYDISYSRVLMVDWLTSTNLPFSITNNLKFKRLLAYNNPCIQPSDVPGSATLYKILADEYERAIGPVTEHLKTTRGLIHYTFDGWTSRTRKSFLGVNAHFVDRDFKQWSFLLGLPPMIGRHRGEEIADEVAETITYFDAAKRYVIQ